MSIKINNCFIGDWEQVLLRPYGGIEAYTPDFYFKDSGVGVNFFFKFKNDNIFLSNMRNKNLTFFYIYLDYPFTYNNYSWKLCATLTCYGASSSHYPNSLYINIVGNGTTCYLTKNNQLVYKYSDYVNGGGRFSLPDTLSFGTTFSFE